MACLAIGQTGLVGSLYAGVYIVWYGSTAFLHMENSVELRVQIALSLPYCHHRVLLCAKLWMASLNLFCPSHLVRGDRRFLSTWRRYPRAIRTNPSRRTKTRGRAASWSQGTPSPRPWSRLTPTCLLRRRPWGETRRFCRFASPLTSVGL